MTLDQGALEGAIQRVRDREIATLDLAIQIGIETYLATAVTRAALAPSTSAATRGDWLWLAAQNALTFYDGLNRDHEDGEALILDELQAALKASVEAAPSPPAPAVESAQVKEALDVAREYVVDGLIAQDQKRRDVEGYPGLMKREQGRLDEVRADLALVDRIRASLDLATDAEG